MSLLLCKLKNGLCCQDIKGKNVRHIIATESPTMRYTITRHCWFSYRLALLSSRPLTLTVRLPGWKSVYSNLLESCCRTEAGRSMLSVLPEVNIFILFVSCGKTKTMIRMNQVITEIVLNTRSRDFWNEVGHPQRTVIRWTPNVVAVKKLKCLLLTIFLSTTAFHVFIRAGR